MTKMPVQSLKTAERGCMGFNKMALCITFQCPMETVCGAFSAGSISAPGWVFYLQHLEIKKKKMLVKKILPNWIIKIISFVCLF